MARNCKYHKIETKVSYDDGQTWESQTPPVYHIGGLIEAHSQDCETGTTLERWITIEGDYLCDGNNKWTKQLLQNSYDGGVTWYASSPTTFRLGEFIGVDVEYCSNASESHYIIPDKTAEELCYEKLSATCVSSGYAIIYKNGSCRCEFVDPIKIVKCTTDTLTEVQLTNGNYGLQTLKIGECTRVIAINPDALRATMRPYLTTIDTTNAVNLEIISGGSFSYCDGWLRATYTKVGNGLQSITIPSSVTTIGEYAFYACSAMTSVTISDAQCSIDSSAFAECRSLRVLDLGNSAVTIGSDAFQSCISLSSVTIPSSVTSIGDDAFYGCTSLTNASIGGGSIGDSAFGDCSGLTSVMLGSGVTSIGGSAFYGCRSLTSVDIPDAVTSIGGSAFYRCISLTSCTIGSGVTSIGGSAFRYCSGLTSITLEATTPPTLSSEVFDSTNNCTIYVPCDSYYAYRNDSSWSRYNSRIRPIQPCDYQYKASIVYTGVTTYDVLCNSNSALTRDELSSGGSRYDVTSVDIGNCTSSISANTFQNCSRLTNIHISSSVTSVGDGAFYGCSALSEVHIDDVAAWCNIDFTTGVNTNPITTSGNLYLNNQRVRSLSIPSGVTSIGNYAFRVFTDLTSMTLSNTVSSIGNSTFYSCRNLSSVDFGSGLTSIGTSAFTWCTGLTSVELPDSITSIGESAFRNCSGATSFGIGSGITSIGASAFTNCSSLTAITISASTPPRLEGNMDRRTFENTNNCPIYVPAASLSTYQSASGWNAYASRIQPIPSTVKLLATYTDSSVSRVCCNDNPTLTRSEITSLQTTTAMTDANIGSCVTSIGESAFQSCTSLSSVTIPSSVTSIGDSAFNQCSGLTSIDIPSGVTRINGYIFLGCTSLTSIDIPSGVTSIGNSAFQGCTSLTSIDIPDSVTSIGSSVFATCSGLTSVTIGSGVTSIGNSAFRYCSGLTSIVIPNSVTSIGQNAFRNCISLSSVTIPSGVTSISNYAFRDCSGLTSITVEATTPPTLSSQVFDDTNDCPIYVPAASLSTYQSASGWSNYASRIQAIT